MSTSTLTHIVRHPATASLMPVEAGQGNCASTWRLGLCCLVLLFGVSLSGCATSLPPPPDSVLLERPIQIWGEQHDHPDHHLARAQWIEQRVAAGERPVVVFEQFDLDQQPMLDQWLRRGPYTAQALVRIGQGLPAEGAPAEPVRGQGWDWMIYQPLLEVVARHQLPVIAGNLPRQQAFRAVHEGISALYSDAELARLGLPANWPAHQQQMLEQRMIDSHCGMLPPQAAPGMVDAQSLRDALLAEAVLQAKRQFPAAPIILITGNGHADRVSGVPVFLQRQGLNPADLAVVLLGDPGSDLAELGADTTLEFRAIRRPDPCEMFRQPAPSIFTPPAGS